MTDVVKIYMAGSQLSTFITANNLRGLVSLIMGIDLVSFEYDGGLQIRAQDFIQDYNRNSPTNYALYTLNRKLNNEVMLHTHVICLFFPENETELTHIHSKISLPEGCSAYVLTGNDMKVKAFPTDSAKNFAKAVFAQHIFDLEAPKRELKEKNENHDKHVKTLTAIAQSYYRKSTFFSALPVEIALKIANYVEHTHVEDVFNSVAKVYNEKPEPSKCTIS